MSDGHKRIGRRKLTGPAAVAGTLAGSASPHTVLRREEPPPVRGDVRVVQ
jgi:hypothetical protein